ncbi:LOW QUALITY PROTEIN: uncharacterized protein LOC122619125 [Drosophila teissieri]|nr:LOW QUALITY PROTEIN: uncharacterized protein LOC122619125 [Drosophila teissieri]
MTADRNCAWCNPRCGMVEWRAQDDVVMKWDGSWMVVLQTKY